MSEAIVAKARAIYGKRLTSEDYKNLLYKNSIGGIADYLRSTPATANPLPTSTKRRFTEVSLNKPCQNTCLSFISGFADLCRLIRTAFAAIF